MISRKVFTEKYNVWHGMPWRMVGEAKNAALDVCMARLNAWRESERVTIITIQEESFESENSDYSPFWVKLVVIFDDVEAEVRMP